MSFGARQVLALIFVLAAAAACTVEAEQGPVRPLPQACTFEHAPGLRPARQPAANLQQCVPGSLLRVPGPSSWPMSSGRSDRRGAGRLHARIRAGLRPAWRAGADLRQFLPGSRLRIPDRASWPVPCKRRPGCRQAGRMHARIRACLCPAGQLLAHLRQCLPGARRWFPPDPFGTLPLKSPTVVRMTTALKACPNRQGWRLASTWKLRHPRAGAERSEVMRPRPRACPWTGSIPLRMGQPTQRCRTKWPNGSDSSHHTFLPYGPR